ncbi:alkaline phosphatase [Echinimonas agarilytica]|uniref:Alkaline phosphatase n=1 Tax=Echinimonas agarilytica TaxID=1215918 RepID=A0AA41W821_9GAMM|nr:alkaline phosphatase [Echinimonas agarilytica]MCM2680659.1 alkaline phosphatase [Echinimonas agarilytica]
MNKLILSASIAAALALTGCDDGDDGANGLNGTNGSSGVNALLVTTQLEVGNANCMGGGAMHQAGQDSDGNGELSESEVTSTSYVCQPYTPPAEAPVADLVGNATSNAWFKQGATKATAAADYAVTPGSAKNVILFVGDGMGVSTVTAARILEGQLKGMMGEENVLSFGEFPFAGLAKTYNVDAQTPDSAGTMTAMVSGVKTDVGVIGVDEDIVRGDCSTVAGNELVTALELAEIAGKSTGVVSTARITHATPAATYAKSADRNWEDISDMPAGSACEDIASQLVNFESNLEARFSGVDIDGIEVVFGGGRRHFLPNDPAANSTDAVSSTEGDRTDGRNLVTEWQAQYATGAYVMDQTGFDAIDTETVSNVFGLFNESHMQYERDRMNDVAGEPSLSEMTSKAIQVLDNNDKGFFLTVESGRIDHAHHAGSAYGALTDTIEFSKAIKAAVDMTNGEETLIIVTADHGHVFTIAGYPKRGNPILGKVVSVGQDQYALAKDGMPYTTLGYTNGKGMRDFGDETNADATYNFDNNTGRKDLLFVDTQSPGYHQEALVPTSSETHAGEDVGIYANGPGASLVSGTNEQSVIFHIMDYAGGLSTAADAAVAD